MTTTLEKEVLKPVKSSEVPMDEILKRFDPVLQKYYGSFNHLKPETDKEKILALRIMLGRGDFHVYGGGETLEKERTALEYTYLTKLGLIKG